MILIFSNNEQEDETDLVCRSLMYHEVPFRRINVDEFQQRNVYVSEDFFVIENEQYHFREFDLVWIRRSRSSFAPPFHDDAFNQESNLKLNRFIQQESKLFLKFLFAQFPKERMVNQASGYSADKIDQLLLAREIGLSIPGNLYANSSSLLQQFERREIINKPGGNLGYLQKGGKTVKAYTEVATAENLPKEFQTSFFQEKIEAVHEIRTLYLDGELFNCGLIKTHGGSHPIDIKNQEGLRCQPVKLPQAFADKIRTFMERIGFRIGFIDILRSRQGYHFIEMNPYGKFLYYSYSCNFNFEHRIANFLMHEARR